MVLFCAPKGDGRFDVAVAPITHTPQGQSVGIEIPGSYMAAAGLDGNRQYVVTNEINEFVWPSPNLVPLPGGGKDDVAVGLMPEGFWKRVRDSFLAERAKKNARSVNHARMSDEIVRTYRKKHRM